MPRDHVRWHKVQQKRRLLNREVAGAKFHDTSGADKSSFEKYTAAYEREQRTARRRLSAETLLHLLDRLCLKLAYAFSARIKLNASPEHGFIRHLVAKLTNELVALSGCIRHGSLQGAWHHVRAVYEMDAAMHYVFSDASLSDTRARQFVEQARVYPWARRRLLELEVEAGRITLDQFKLMNMVSDDLISYATPDVVAEWLSLFGEKNDAKLAKRKQWHDGTIRDLLVAKDPTGGAYGSYERCCLSTHVSVLGHRLSSPNAPRLFGFDPPQALGAIDIAFTRAFEVIKQVDSVLNGVVMGHVVDEAQAFVEAQDRVRSPRE